MLKMVFGDYPVDGAKTPAFRPGMKRPGFRLLKTFGLRLRSDVY